ncbi:MAG: hypothetical protein E6Q90_04450 [Actinobacteria bacterium]|nr:MAG: hypothetical protein E6Q90_04450 [Actinomycetota bacterium]
MTSRRPRHPRHPPRLRRRPPRPRRRPPRRPPCLRPTWPQCRTPETPAPTSSRHSSRCPRTLPMSCSTPTAPPPRWSP